jgi:hypothetical protein
MQLQNAKRDRERQRQVDELKDRAERSEKEVMPYAEAGRCNAIDAFNAKQQRDEQKRISDRWEYRAKRAEWLLAAVLFISAVYLFSHRVGLLLAIVWLAITCLVYVPRLLPLTDGGKGHTNGRMRAVVSGILEHFENRLQRVISRLRLPEPAAGRGDA